MLLYETPDEHKFDKAPAVFVELIERYTIGDYDYVINYCAGELNNSPEIFEYYELIASASIYADVPIPTIFVPGSIGHELLSTVDALLRRIEPQSAVQALLRLATLLDGCSLGTQLAAFAYLHDPCVPRPTAKRSVAAASTFLTPRFAKAYSKKDKALTFLEILSSQWGSTSPSIAVYQSMVTGDIDNIPGQVPSTRRFKYAARGLLESGRPAEALIAYQAVAGGSQGIQAMIEEATVGVVEAAVQLEDWQLAANTVVNTYFDNPTFLRWIDLSTLAQKIEHVSVSPDFTWPLFWHVVFKTYPGERTKQRIANAVEDLLESLGAAHPSDLIARANQFPTTTILRFLGSVCVTDVLDYMIAYESTADLEAERMRLAEALLTLDPGKTSDYQEEIALLLQAAAIREMLQQIEETRVHVDVAGILEQLGSSFEQRFVRFKAFSDLAAEYRRSHAGEDVSDQLKIEKALKLFRDTADLIRNTDLSYTYFLEMFQELTKRYVSSNEYGLDSYLSVRIRHGTLSGQLRSQFDKQRLLTQKPSHDADYAENTHWKQLVAAEFGQPTAVAVDRRLREFARQVDSIIEAFKRDRVQIKTKEKDLGLFDFQFTGEHLEAVWRRSFEVASYGEFLEVVFGVLYQRTVRNLESVVSYVRRDLAKQLSDALTALGKDVAEIRYELGHSELGQAIKQCGTAVQNELTVIAGWFMTGGGSKVISYRMKMLTDTVIDTVKRMYPTYGVVIENNVDSDITLIGSFLPNVFYILLILLDNAVRHSGGTHTHTEITATKNAGYVHLAVANRLYGGIAEARRAAEKATVSTDSWRPSEDVRRETGSGFHKLHKILRFDLRREKLYDITAVVTEDEKFWLSYRFSGLIQAAA